MRPHSGRTPYPPPLAPLVAEGGAPRVLVRRSSLRTFRVVALLLVAAFPAALEITTPGVGLRPVLEAALLQDAQPARGGAEATDRPAGAPSVPVDARPALQPADRDARPSAPARPPAPADRPSPAREATPPPPVPAPTEEAAAQQSGSEPVVADAVAATGGTVMLDGVRYRVQSAQQPWSVRVSPSSNYSRFELRAGDQWNRDAAKFPDGRQRAKLRGEIRYAPDAEVWMAYSFRWSGEMSRDWGNITELHSDAEDGESGRKPPPFSISVGGGRLELFTRADTRSTTTSKESPTERFSMPLPAAGEWQDVVVRVKLDPSGDGRLTFWLNGQQLHDSGAIPVGYNDRVGPYFKFGLYRGMSDASTVMEFANVEVGTTSLQGRVGSPRPIPSA